MAMGTDMRLIADLSAENEGLKAQLEALRAKHSELSAMYEQLGDGYMWSVAEACMLREQLRTRREELSSER